jgi:hypothetical protein
MRRQTIRKLLAQAHHTEVHEGSCPICTALFKDGERAPDFVFSDEFGETEVYALDLEPEEG